MNVLEAREISKTYYIGSVAVTAIKDISINFSQGTFTSIIGKSGSGKTTLLRILGGLDIPTSGEILLNGQTITCLGDGELAKIRRRKIGFVFQDFRLLGDLTIWENILLPHTLDNSKPDLPFLTSLMEMLDIMDLKNRFPEELSGGEKQRVAIARAYSHKPNIILADEPTGNLDKRSGENVLQLFQLTQQEMHQTVVLVTHDLELARHAQRIVTISDGTIASDAAKESK